MVGPYRDSRLFPLSSFQTHGGSQRYSIWFLVLREDLGETEGCGNTARMPVGRFLRTSSLIGKGLLCVGEDAILVTSMSLIQAEYPRTKAPRRLAQS